MQQCAETNLLERIMLKAVARKAICNNLKEMRSIFYLFDKQNRNFFNIDEFKQV